MLVLILRQIFKQLTGPRNCALYQTGMSCHCCDGQRQGFMQRAASLVLSFRYSERAPTSGRGKAIAIVSCLEPGLDPEGGGIETCKESTEHYSLGMLATVHYAIRTAAKLVKGTILLGTFVSTRPGMPLCECLADFETQACLHPVPKLPLPLPQGAKKLSRRKRQEDTALQTL